MISMVEGAKRQKTPNEIALNILLAAFTIVFLVVCVTLLPFSIYSVDVNQQGTPDYDHRPGRPAGLPDPDHHWRTAARHRYRRNGPSDPAQCNRSFRSGSGGGRRRRCTASGQNRDHHPGQPAGSRIYTGRAKFSHANWRRQPNWLHWQMKHPKDAASSCWPKKSMVCGARQSEVH